MRNASPARALRTLLVLALAAAGVTCVDDPPTGPGRLAPSAARIAFAAEVAADAPGTPLAPYRKARVQLFTVPGETLARDTTITFADGDTTSTVSVGVTVTSVNQQFILALTLLDDNDQVVYSARDTVVAFVPGSSATPPPPKVIVLVYAGADTAARTLVVAPRDSTLTAGDAVRYRAVASRGDGSAIAGAVIAFSAAGSGISVDADGTVHANAPVARGGAFVIARLATGLSDSTQVTVIPRVARVVLTPAAAFGLLVDSTRTVAAEAQDAGGAVLARTFTWSSSAPAVATVTVDVAGQGVVHALAAGSTVITASAAGQSASVTVTVSLPLPSGPASIAIAPTSATFASLGDLVSFHATVRDASGAVLAAPVTFVTRNPGVATVASDGDVRSIANGGTWVVASTGALSDSARVTVRQLVDTILVSRDTVILALGDTATIDATLLDHNRNVITDIAPAFSSANSAVATVSALGRIMLVGPGATQVFALAGNASTAVQVIQGQGTTGLVAKLAWIRVTPGGGSVRMGGTLPLVAELVDASGAATVITPQWASDQPGRAPVSATGVVTLVDTTTVTITATSQGIAGHATFSVQAAPAVNAFSFAPTTLSGVSTSTLRFSVSVGASDPGSGIASVAVEFTAPDGTTRGCTAASPTVGSAQRGTWDCAISIPPGSAAGSWHATRVTLAGTITRTLDETQLATYGATTLTVTP